MMLVLWVIDPPRSEALTRLGQEAPHRMVGTKPGSLLMAGSVFVKILRRDEMASCISVETTAIPRLRRGFASHTGTHKLACGRFHH
jgi:hypothetical protein